MKIKLKHITVFLGVVTSLVTLGIKGLDFYNKIKTENSGLKETLTKRTIHYNESTNYQYNKIGELIKEQEICETTQEIIKQNSKSDNKTINEYEYLLDSVVTVLEYRTNPIEAINKNVSPNLSTNISQPEIKSLKSKVFDPKLSSIPKEKSRLRKLFSRNK